jgi:hypothetical protein
MEQLTIHVATGVVVIGPPGLFAAQVVAACRRGQEMAALQYLRRDKDALARVRRWRDAEAHFPGVLRESDDRLVAMVEDAVRRHRLVAFYVPKAPASYNGGDIVERRAPVAAMDKSPDARIRAMTRIERLTEALTRCVKPAIMGPELTAYMTQLVREGAIPILAMYLLGIGIAHLAAPEVALLIDAALILFVAVQIGRTGTEALVALVTATVEAMDAKDEATIERSATAYAHALVALGGAVFLAWLLKRLPKYRAMKGGPSKGAAPPAAPPKAAPKPKKLIPAPKTSPKKAAGFGAATSNDYRSTFFNAHPELEGKVVVHHAVEQQVATRYPGVVSQAEMHSYENLRGVPKELNSDLHLSQIRREWNQFYRQNAKPSPQQLLDKATEIDAKFGSLFKPPR